MTRLASLLPETIDRVASLLASIPSPSSGDVDLGSVSIHLYGLMLLLGIVAATWLTGVRWTRQGGDWDLVFRVAMWGVAGGIAGARLYHVLTSWNEVPDEWWGVFAVWKGGLGIWGAIAGGVIVGAWIVRSSGESVYAFMDVVAPGLMLAQAIGRWGNYFNQELFGTPTDLPWGLEIDLENRPAAHLESDTFHPLFLYEGLWNLLGMGLLLWLGSRFRIRPPGLFALYVAWYTFARFFLELIRTDEAHEFLGLRLNNYVALGVFLLALAAFVWSQRRLPDRPSQPRRTTPAGPHRTLPKGRVRRGS
jgi:prolipoprotein diacylglyceryl transferase